MHPLADLGATFANVSHLFDSPNGQIFLRMFFSLFAGGVIGLEREYHGRAAGFRTHMLVCLGCCVIMLVSISFGETYGDLGADSTVRVDPARLAYGVVAGIGFLGAGVILKEGGTVHGLTTAASLWSVAALGLAAGVGLFRLAALATALTVVSLVGMRWIGRAVPGHVYGTIRVTQAGRPNPDPVAAAIRATGVKIERVAVEDECAANQSAITFSVRASGDMPVTALLERIHESGEFLRIKIT
jgi:putative Mg2+ transporter-C (MgtC) family protein